ncbi:hypothetical protein STSP_68650 [Streptomyces jeddahensis]|uniref:Transposase IS701-like DDE domain-containing protein n=1 Tax=Streptomyces jeddahensis TaxID=1716141 RepID=A0A177HGF4_9ACTN|nr:hypothetical protein STSP_68650 [Streptomyces jeddahensis]
MTPSGASGPACRRRRHREKWRLALDALDELATWHLGPPVVVADAGYGQNADFRAAPAERGHAHVVGIRGDITVQPHEAHPAAPAWSRNGYRPVPRYRQPPVTVAQLAAAAGQEAFSEATWREGSRGPMTLRFLALLVRPAGCARVGWPRQPVAEHGRWDGVLPQVRLLAECPTARTNRPVLAVRPARRHPDRRPGPPGKDPLAHRARLPRTQARTGPGPLRRPLLAGLAPPRHPGHRRPCLPHRAAAGPKSRHTGLTLYQILDALQNLLNCPRTTV